MVPIICLLSAYSVNSSRVASKDLATLSHISPQKNNLYLIFFVAFHVTYNFLQLALGSGRDSCFGLVLVLRLVLLTELRVTSVRAEVPPSVELAGTIGLPKRKAQSLEVGSRSDTAKK